MNMKESTALGQHLAELIQPGHFRQAYTLLAPLLTQRTPFRYLGRAGEIVGAESINAVNPFLEHIAQYKTEGGWVVIGAALGAQMDRDVPGAFARCRDFIVLGGDTWYVADILGERAPGPALVNDFDAALDELSPWREDDNPWIRRTVGVAVHFWAKRSRGTNARRAQAALLLHFLEPLFTERDPIAIKGIGWGLKTLGRQYPDLVTDWLADQIVQRQRQPRALMLRKALTYLSADQRALATGETAT